MKAFGISPVEERNITCANGAEKKSRGKETFTDTFAANS